MREIDPRALIGRGYKPLVRLRADGCFYLLWFKCMPPTRWWHSGESVLIEEWHGPFPSLQLILAWWYGWPPYEPVPLR
jgi:hypothetical protein